MIPTVIWSDSYAMPRGFDLDSCVILMACLYGSYCSFIDFLKVSNGCHIGCIWVSGGIHIGCQ